MKDYNKLTDNQKDNIEASIKDTTKELLEDLELKKLVEDFEKAKGKEKKHIGSLLYDFLDKKYKTSIIEASKKE